MSQNPLRAGLIPLHILYHAANGEIYGQGMIQELRHHGYSALGAVKLQVEELFGELIEERGPRKRRK